VIRLALGLVTIALSAATAMAAPPLPTRFQVVPVYATTPVIKLSWTEAGGASAYTIYRKTVSTQEAVMGSVPGGAAGHRAAFIDTAAVAGVVYTYRLEACDTTCASLPPITTSIATVWPISGRPRRVLNGFNENIAWAGVGDANATTGFHYGVDLGRTTTLPTAADDILAPRGGVVSQVIIGPPTSQDDGFIEIRVDVGNGTFELDGFNHIDTNTPPTVMIGDSVAPGQKIAVIGDSYFTGDRPDHTHYQLGRSDSPLISVRNPLTVFTDDADRDPLGNLPGLNDENGDGKQVLYRDHTTGNLLDYDLATKPLHGDIDVAAEVTDRQGTKPEQAPLQLAYWIDGPLPDSEQLDDVKSAAKPYRVYDFRTDYWGAPPPSACDDLSLLDDAANYGFNGLKPLGCTKAPPSGSSVLRDTEPVLGVVFYPWPILHHFIVTHASTETGVRTGLSKNQFWRTAAKDDGASAESTHANYAGQPTTTKAWEARFPDGDYTIHVLASDLVHHDVDVKLPTTRLENFAPFVRQMIVAVDADGNPATGLVDTPGCEAPVYSYRQPARKQYPDAFTLAVTRSAAGLQPVRAGSSVCVLVRFSEPMNDAVVEMVRARGGGPLLAAVTGGFEKTWQQQDTWRGKATLAADPSGASDSNIANDEKDVAIRVTAHDRRDAANVMRALDTDGDGSANASGDVNHLVKVDLSPMKKTVTVTK
jgi:hypothetical protein